MSETIEELKKKIVEYEKRMGIGENDPAKDGYLVLVKLLRQQNEYLKSFEIKTKIGSLTKEDAEYPRAKDMWENLPKMITSVTDLKITLKMEGEEKKSSYTPISAKEIANGHVQR